MSPLRWWSVLLLVLSLAAGGGLLLQRQVAAQLRDERGLLREDQRELARLQAERTRLQAAQPSPAEWEQLRGDRAAVQRLRGELDLLRTRVQAMARSAERAALPLTPTATLGNAGRATPAAAMETLFWAAAHHDAGSIAAMLKYGPKLRAAADLFFGQLPEAVRQKYGNINDLIGQSTADELAVAAMRVVEQEPAAGSAEGEKVAVLVRTQSVDGFAREQPFVLTHGDEGWRLEVSPQMVQRIANRLQSEAAEGN